jgi:hypothetical protein
MHIQERYSFRSVHMHTDNTSIECETSIPVPIHVWVRQKDWKVTYVNVQT